MIEGLTLTVSGEELRSLLQQRVIEHQERAARWKHEQTRTAEDQTEDAPLLPDEMCANEEERHEWRAAVLQFIRDRIQPAEVYLLGEADLAFGELLPSKPWCVEQEEFESRTAVGFHLERLTRTLSALPGVGA
jgi:hypothetical protein